MENNNLEKKKEDIIDLSYKEKSNLIQAVINLDVFGKPKCKTRRRRKYGSRSFNR